MYRVSTLLLLLICSINVAAKLPVVDLGYQLHRAQFYNSTGDYYYFHGIRYAQNPTGPLRWKPPQTPPRNRKQVQDGSNSNNCYPSTPGWNNVNNIFVQNYLAGKPPGVTKAELRKDNSSKGVEDNFGQPGLSEDCLFLDVAVPKQIFDSKSNGAPVLVWFYGGGYVKGTAMDAGNPAGLLYRSLQNGREGVVYVTFNYRLGALGWLAGPTIEKSGIANAGLYDQRFVLEWVQKHIAKFGGDPNRVTIFGESAGGGSILHQITAFGGKGTPPFQQAILQSPGFHQQNSPHILENQYNRFLQLTGAKSVHDLRNLPIKEIVHANAVQVLQAEFGLFVYGPAVDNSFVPKLPGELLLEGKYYKNLKVMTGHNSDEGLVFVDPFVKTQKQFKGFVRLMFPTANKTVVNQISDKLYPPNYSGKYPYTDPYARQALAISENAFVCNANYVDRAFDGYAYVFAIPPGLHGEDVPYTYYNNGDEGLVNNTVAIVLQDYITTFAQNGVPSSPDVPGLPKFERYGKSGKAISLGATQITSIIDPGHTTRCRYWQKAPYAH